MRDFRGVVFTLVKTKLYIRAVNGTMLQVASRASSMRMRLYGTALKVVQQCLYTSVRVRIRGDHGTVSSRGYLSIAASVFLRADNFGDEGNVNRLTRTDQ